MSSLVGGIGQSWPSSTLSNLAAPQATAITPISWRVPAKFCHQPAQRHPQFPTQYPNPQLSGVVAPDRTTEIKFRHPAVPPVQQVGFHSSEQTAATLRQQPHRHNLCGNTPPADDTTDHIPKPDRHPHICGRLMIHRRPGQHRQQRTNHRSNLKRTPNTDCDCPPSHTSSMEHRCDTNPQAAPSPELVLRVKPKAPATHPLTRQPESGTQPEEDSAGVRDYPLGTGGKVSGGLRVTAVSYVGR